MAKTRIKVLYLLFKYINIIYIVVKYRVSVS